jgi:salicylate hydroxylase
MQKSPVTIGGAGIAGLAAALALGKRETVLLEQAKAFSDVGASLQLGPNAVRALQKLGAWDAVSPITSSPPEIHMRDGITGQLLKRLILGKSFEQQFGAPYRVARRADLHAALLSCVAAKPNVHIKFGVTLAGVRILDNHVQLDVNGTRQTVSTLVAADGVRSHIREILFPKAEALASGKIYHRGQAPLQDIRDIDVACVNVWLCPQGHVVQYPAGETQRLNIVAITPANETPGAFFRTAAPALQQVLATCDTAFTQWPGLYVNPLPHWTDGKIMLIGDAAHATLPFLAQGAAMALEDAAALHSALATQENMAAAFQQTQAQRLRRTTKLHELSLAAGKIYHHAGVMRMARNMVLRVSPANILSRRMAWIYKG